jgi:hypothetical protein
MATEQQIEAVATAIHDAYRSRGKRRPRSWDKAPQQGRRDFRKEAEAAIAAYESVRAG